jgi:hypothetical protein
MTPTVVFQAGADAIALHEHLILTPVGAVATYARLGDAIGKPVNGSCGALRTARLIAQREDGAIFSCIKGEGLKRLDDEGIVALAGVETLSVRRRARTVGRRLGAAVFENLREASRMRAIAIASVLAVVSDLTREKSVLRVTAAASGRAAQLPIRETLQALGLQI